MLSMVLALVAAPVHALGLGQIVVRSGPGQPLLAEIPVISGDAAELQQLQARMASPETLARIGRTAPVGAAAELQFTVALDAQGQPVIRVTTLAPVLQPSINFLVEVDWEQGRLVREYSALIDRPRTLPGVVQPPLQAPMTGPSNVIVRPEPPPRVELPPPPAPATAVAPTAPPDRVAPDPAAAVAISVPPPPPSPVQPVATAPADDTPRRYGPVASGQTLSEIAASIGPAGFTADQIMLALLRANPDAFIGDDINWLKRGVVLRVPAAPEVAQYESAEASAVVRAQIERWREARRTPLQPALAGPTATAVATPARPRATLAPGRRTAARLQIAPPGEGGAAPAGTRSGISANGEGDMLRNELQQTTETLAARDAELRELRGRVTELEQLQTQQQRLLTMKDNELAAAQQRLATAGTPEATAGSERAGQPWLWGGLVAVLLAALGWWLLRRRNARPATSPRGYDSATLAAGITHAQTKPAPTATSALDTYGGSSETDVMMPPWHAGAPVADSPDRLAHARACIDRGDHQAARDLLQDIAASDDAIASAEATRLLRTLS